MCGVGGEGTGWLKLELALRLPRGGRWAREGAPGAPRGSSGFPWSPGVGRSYHQLLGLRSACTSLIFSSSTKHVSGQAKNLGHYCTTPEKNCDLKTRCVPGAAILGSRFPSCCIIIDEYQTSFPVARPGNECHAADAGAKNAMAMAILGSCFSTAEAPLYCSC